MFTPMQRSEITGTPTDGSIPRREAYPVPEIAVLLGDVSVRYVWKIVDTGELPSFKSGGRRLVAAADLKAYIEGLRDDDQRAREAATVTPIRHTFEATA